MPGDCAGPAIILGLLVRPWVSQLQDLEIILGTIFQAWVGQLKSLLNEYRYDFSIFAHFRQFINLLEKGQLEYLPDESRHDINILAHFRRFKNLL